MLINKVIFTSSIEYSDFWEINSKVFKKHLDIEPLLLLFGSKSGLSEEYGKIIEMEFIPDLPKMIQIAMWKFYYTKIEPDTTWMIGDIDQIPLQRDHFEKNIASVDPNGYAHLAENNCSRRVSRNDKHWRTGKCPNGSTNLPGHYHAAKGDTFRRVLNLDLPFRSHIEDLIQERLKIMGVSSYDLNDFEQRNHFWAYEETYTTNMIRNNDVFGFSKDPALELCRSKGLNYDINTLNQNQYIDIHCPRPYKSHKKVIDKIVEGAWK